MGSESAVTDGRRYAAMLLFQFRVVTAGVSNKRRLCEKRLILLTAANGKAALRAAKRRGREGQHSYLNSDGGRVRFEFVGILDLLHLGVECDPDEVYYQLLRLSEPMERRARLLPPESRLQGIAEDQRHAKPGAAPGGGGQSVSESSRSSVLRQLVSGVVRRQEGFPWWSATGWGACT